MRYGCRAVRRRCGLAAFAQAPEPGGPASEAETPAVPGATPAAAPAPPARPRPYKDVLRDAKAVPGFFTLHQKDEKVWLEIRPEQFEAPFFFSYNIRAASASAFVR